MCFNTSKDTILRKNTTCPGSGSTSNWTHWGVMIYRREERHNYSPKITIWHISVLMWEMQERFKWNWPSNLRSICIYIPIWQRGVPHLRMLWMILEELVGCIWWMQQYWTYFTERKPRILLGHSFISPFVTVIPCLSPVPDFYPHKHLMEHSDEDRPLLVKSVPQHLSNHQQLYYS